MSLPAPDTASKAQGGCQVEVPPPSPFLSCQSPARYSEEGNKGAGVRPGRGRLLRDLAGNGIKEAQANGGVTPSQCSHTLSAKHSHTTAPHPFKSVYGDQLDSHRSKWQGLNKATAGPIQPGRALQGKPSPATILISCLLKILADQKQRTFLQEQIEREKHML